MGSNLVSDCCHDDDHSIYSSCPRLLTFKGNLRCGLKRTWNADAKVVSISHLTCITNNSSSKRIADLVNNSEFEKEHSASGSKDQKLLIRFHRSSAMDVTSMHAMSTIVVQISYFWRDIRKRVGYRLTTVQNYNLLSKIALI
ncbi:hypothetical protein AVEN_177547-1 [Araneus ventricosus]|uniref:Uncharacterized protein n=1 Tax=Araneus ventricosus TaxID=182803 RepID=A0A4Y2SMM2_ARAVE|nr:hypothetical protein AVEN_177547-1 [Araneus ventricosus]